MLITRPRTIVAQVEEILRRRIYDEAYPPGSKLPSEFELLSEFDVSRATVRSALTKLAAEGLIIRKQGDGTYVNERVQTVNAQLSGFWDYVRLIERSGYVPSVELVDMTVREATEEETAVLRLQPSTSILSLRRLLMADGKPVILTTNSFPTGNLLHMNLEKFNGRLHIQAFTQQYLGQQITYSIVEVHPRLSTDDISHLLGIGGGVPILSLKSTFYNRKNEPIFCGVSYHDDTKLSLRLMQAWE